MVVTVEAVQELSLCTDHSGKFELETRFVLEFLANSNILNRSFPTNLGSILQRNPVCGQVCKLPRNLSIV